MEAYQCLCLVCHAYSSISQADTQCKGSNAHLLLADTHSTQSTICHLLFGTVNISTLEALKVCVWCVMHIQVYLKQTHSVKEAMHTCYWQTHTVYTVNNLSLAVYSASHQYFRSTQSLCLVCHAYSSISQADTHYKGSNAHLPLADTHSTQSTNCHLLL